jgi:hypothetical protein
MNVSICRFAWYAPYVFACGVFVLINRQQEIHGQQTSV